MRYRPVLVVVFCCCLLLLFSLFRATAKHEGSSPFSEAPVGFGRRRRLVRRPRADVAGGQSRRGPAPLIDPGAQLFAADWPADWGFVFVATPVFCRCFFLAFTTAAAAAAAAAVVDVDVAFDSRYRNRTPRSSAALVATGLR